MEDDTFVGNEKSYSTSRYKASHQKVNRNTRKYKEKHNKDVEGEDSVVVEYKKKNEDDNEDKDDIDHLSEEGMLQNIFDKKNEDESEECENKNWISDEDFKRQRALKKNKHLVKKEKREKKSKEE